MSAYQQPGPKNYSGVKRHTITCDTGVSYDVAIWGEDGVHFLEAFYNDSVTAAQYETLADVADVQVHDIFQVGLLGFTEEELEPSTIQTIVEDHYKLH